MGAGDGVVVDDMLFEVDDWRRIASCCLMSLFFSVREEIVSWENSSSVDDSDGGLGLNGYCNE